MFRNSIMKGLFAGGGALTALVAPIVLAAPAQAVTAWDGCTFTPTAPSSTYLPTGQKVVNYRGSANCAPGLGKTIRVERQRWEQDLGDPDDFLGSTSSLVNGPLWWDQFAVPNTDTVAGDDHEEIYARVRVQVTTNGVPGPWSTWVTSGVSSIRVF